MASIASDPNGRKAVRFVGRDGKHRTLRLGKASKSDAQMIRVHVERLNAASIMGTAPADETSRWLASLGEPLRSRLAAVGLTVAPNRLNATMGVLLDEFFASINVKGGTETTYRQ